MFFFETVAEDEVVLSALSVRLRACVYVCMHACRLNCAFVWSVLMSGGS